MSSLGSLFNFENMFSKGIGRDVAHNPWRLVTGVDPASTTVWNKALGHDDKPLVNAFGSPGDQYYDEAKAKGIDTTSAQNFHHVADTIAGIYGAQGIAGAAGYGGEAAGGGGEASGGGGMNYGRIAQAIMKMNGGQGQGGGYAAQTPNLQIDDGSQAQIQAERERILQAQMALARGY